MKNKLYVVYGGKWDVERNYWENPSSLAYMTFKNREKADRCVDNLLEGYLRMKSYSPSFNIGDTYELPDTPIKTYATDITDKKGEVVFTVEMLEIDLSKIVM